MARMTVQNKDIIQLWEKYKTESAIDIKHQIVIHYIWLVKYVLKSMHLPSNSILDNEDFLNVGILGLHEAIERFQLDKGVKFESYAIPRIRGIIQDELRRLDWLSRTARKRAHDYLHAGDELRSQKGREVTTEEIRKKLNVTQEEYQSYLSAAAAARASMYLNENSQAKLGAEETDFLEELPDPDDDNSLLRLENEERLTFITTYLQKLEERKRLVMTLYYYESLTFKEIGQILKVSESRICQIHSQVVGHLRKKLHEFDNA